MNRTENNGSKRSRVIEPTVEPDPPKQPAEAQGDGAKQPYVPADGKKKPSLRDNTRVLVIFGGIGAVLLILMLRGIPHQTLAPGKRAGVNKQEQSAKPPDNGAIAAYSVLPVMDSGRRPEDSADKSMVRPEEIARTANKQQKPPAGASLAGIPPFGNSQAANNTLNQPVTPPIEVAQNQEPSQAAETRSEREALEKPSLVFVRTNKASSAVPRPQESNSAPDLGIGMPPGTRLRARLESAASTAVQTPVVAVVEYNYERNGEIVVPAGAKVFGRLEAADRSGYIGVRFDSMMLPDGSSVRIEAAATDLELRPLKGKVEGKHTGKNILVRSFAGIGEIAATLAGRSSLNQPLSEGDLLREKISNNIAQASDQQVASLAISEHLVISVSAGTELYVVLQKPATATAENRRAPSPVPAQTATQPGVEELRQLLQLQRELSQGTTSKPSPE